MPSPDAGVVTTPAGNVPFSAPFPERRRFSFRATTVWTQGVLWGVPCRWAAAGEWAASSHQATQLGSFPPRAHAAARLLNGPA